MLSLEPRIMFDGAMASDIASAPLSTDDLGLAFIDDDEKIEVKCTQFNGHGAATKWSGGKGSRAGKFLLISHDLSFENIFVAFTSLDKLDWGNPDANQKKTMKLSDWYTNHKDDKDLQIWKGNVQIIKTNKIKEGQVQMSLSPVNEPI